VSSKLPLTKLVAEMRTGLGSYQESSKGGSCLLWKLQLTLPPPCTGHRVGQGARPHCVRVYSERLGSGVVRACQLFSAGAQCWELGFTVPLELS
jgi:hypothetical protein